ncbi:MAG: PAS domain-containing protein [Parvibaculum sp.]|uniref:PAS domain-containing protein n=1 Tax=Parvibaculum sp. TaxID=2024848 RepID=UPI003C73BFFF
MAPTPGRACRKPQPRSSTLTALFDYWSSLPAAGGLPAAADFRPAEIARCLPDTAILEIRSPDVVTYRLAGTGIAERMGHDPTGANVLDLVAASSRQQAGRDLLEIFHRPCGLHLRYVNTYASGRVTAIESLYLPLRPPAGAFPRVISVHAPEDVIEYTHPLDLSLIAETINDAIWIDLGFGTPAGDQPRP